MAESPAAPAKSSPALPLQLTAFVFMVGISLVTLEPALFMMNTLGSERGMRLLTLLSATSAAAEIALSPFFGGLTDSLGRKPVVVGTMLVACLTNLATAVYPTVALVALSKFVASLVIGIFFLAAGALLADNFRSEPAKLAAARASSLRSSTAALASASRCRVSCRAACGTATQPPPPWACADCSSARSASASLSLWPTASRSSCAASTRSPSHASSE